MADTLDGLISFFSSFYAVRAEKALKRAGYEAELIPGPKELSPNCGVALRFQYEYQEAVITLLTEKKVQIDNIHYYIPRSEMWEIQQLESTDDVKKEGRKWLNKLLGSK